MAAAAGRPCRPVPLRRRGVPLPRRPPAAARQQRHRQVQGARAHAAVPAGRRAGPHRVEPDADPGKRMEWNLLLGGRYQERLGYTWLELGRLAEDGSPAYLTLGCGLKAVARRGIAARWFFVTTRR